MKLRNKKTGEITTRIDVSESGEKFWVLGKKPCMYDTFAELNAEWEDYKPAEPLIKDEKIRKVIRAWAEVNGVKTVAPRGVGDTLLYFIGEDKGKKLIEIEFYANVDNYTHLASKDTYTIAELCGEEEE